MQHLIHNRTIDNITFDICGDRHSNDCNESFTRFTQNLRFIHDRKKLYCTLFGFNGIFVYQNGVYLVEIISKNQRNDMSDLVTLRQDFFLVLSLSVNILFNHTTQLRFWNGHYLKFIYLLPEYHSCITFTLLF
jgi:hypothetical protein